MTNAEKFNEVFGFEPDNECCIMPDRLCGKVQEIQRTTNCDDCPFYHFFEKDYKPLFQDD